MRILGLLLDVTDGAHHLLLVVTEDAYHLLLVVDCESFCSHLSITNELTLPPGHHVTFFFVRSMIDYLHLH